MQWKTALANWPRLLRQVLLFVIICLLLSCLAMVVGCFINDRNIESNMGQSVANVRSVELLRTTVDFVDENGDFQSPPTGLLYPVGLEEGQRVRVEYDRTDPNVVRVAGRTWTLSLLPATSIAVVAFLVVAPLWWSSLRATRRLQRDPQKVNRGSLSLSDEMEN
ncbi:DUF3592 domain-containing protein [Corynebacterium amycolatum]|uniref:DUF3592 domain-containing protein n=1 Tax=Corynebacterium amycolatum TaxID=43765 RepID=UPI00065FCEE1|nr:DUF3592 domain-containing protein [Corynebacterium amycolatum]KAA9222521.1 DUF3592 domain-containing protein [Corynebacterium amycolatum]MCA0443309.1 DUF3592 domain-containing protein [Corynebacterium amycolatum]